MQDSSCFGKGAIPVPQEIKDKHFILGATPPPIIDWSIPFQVDQSKIMQSNQTSSLSCTAQATRYYTETLEWLNNKLNENYSARFIYSQTYQPSGGAWISDAMSIPLKFGVASLASVPDGDSSEIIMRDRNLNSKAILEARAEKYALLPNTHNIDYLASVVKQYNGFVTGFQGNDTMFSADGTVNVPTSQDWGHCVYVCGYELRNGVKCLKFRNSWGSAWGTNGYGYFPETFVKNGVMFDAYTYADVLDLINMGKLVTADNHTIWFALNGTRFWILDPNTLAQGNGKLWSSPAQSITEEELMAMPYGGGLFLTQTDSPKS